MKSGFLFGLLLFTFLSIFTTVSCKKEPDSGTRVIDENTTVTAAPEGLDISKVSFLEVAEFERQSQKGSAVLVDVRMPQEYGQGHIEGATNINFFEKEFKDNLLALDKDKKYFLYCKNETRSKMAAAFMEHNDFEEVYVLKGGFDAWKKEGGK